MPFLPPEKVLFNQEDVLQIVQIRHFNFIYVFIFL